MPRKPRIFTSLFPYHVTARSNNKDWFYSPIELVWSIMAKHLQTAQQDYQLRILNFVLMNNHFHMLAETPLSNLGDVMNYFMREVSREIGKKSGRINHVFGGRYHATVIREPYYFAHAYKYVYRNPVRANLVKSVQLYPYSTLQNLWKASTYEIPTVFANHNLAHLIPKERESLIKWLNQALPKECDEILRKALKKSEFKLSSRRNDRKAVQILNRYQKEAGTSCSKAPK